MKKFGRFVGLILFSLITPLYPFEKKFSPYPPIQTYVKVNFNEIEREYCYVLTFTAGWQYPPAIKRKTGGMDSFMWDINSGDYEFRVPVGPSTIFIVRGLDKSYGRLSGNYPLHPESYYTTNIYKVDLADRVTPPQPATQEEWDAAFPVRLDPSPKGFEVTQYPTDFIRYKGIEFKRTGARWDIHSALLSLDKSLLSVHSWSGKVGLSNRHGPYGKTRGTLYFDFYQADTGKKVVTVTAQLNYILPQEVFQNTAWLSERFFVMPLDDERNKCMVCEFGRMRQ